MTKLSLNLIQILKVIYEIQEKSKYGVASTSEILNRFEDKNSVRVRLTYLKKDGYIEQPMRGAYRLTEEGMRILKLLNIGD